MKIRLKHGKVFKTQEVDESCTTLDLQQLVLQLFPDIKSDFTLSLNKKDALDENKTLLEQGIISGDVVYLLVTGTVDTSCGTPVQKPQPLSNVRSIQSQQRSNDSIYISDVRSESASQHNEETNSSEYGQHRHSSGACCYESDMDTKEHPCDTEEEGKVDHLLVNRYLNEPVLCRESKNGVVPTILNNLHESVHVSSPMDAMCIVLHVLMLETGFTALQKSESCSIPHNQDEAYDVVDQAEMPKGWNDKPGQYCMSYVHPTCSEGDASFALTCVPMGSMVVINGQVTGVEESISCHLNLKLKDYVENINKEAGSCYKNLGKLSRVFKDSIALPLVQRFRAGRGLPPLHGILAVSHEVKLRILGKLDVVSVLRMSETCKEWNSLCKDRYVWRRVYLQDFGNRSNNSLNQDWGRLYRQEYKLRKERRRIWKRTPIPMFIPPVLPSFGLPPPGPFHPGILNGENDLDPVLSHHDRRLFPSSQIDQRSSPSSSLFRPRFDPVGPLPGQMIQPGRSSGQRDGRAGFGGGFNGPRLF